MSVVVVLILGVMMALVGGSAGAATLANDEVYRLPAGQVIKDNLYVTAGEIYIDGAIDGDLVAFGGYIEVNGAISGDVLAMAGGIVINGPVAGDVRIGGGGLTVNGSIGGDLVSAGGGASFSGVPAMPITAGQRTIEQGTILTRSASVGKDALMAGGTGRIEGTIARSLWAAFGTLELAATIGGDANIVAGQFNISDATRVGGTLSYSTDSAPASSIPSGVAADVEQRPTGGVAARPQPTLAERFIGWTISVARALLGLLVLGLVFIRLTPQFTQRTVAAMNERALLVLGVGALVALLAFPVISLVAALAWLFWGFIAGGIVVIAFGAGLIGVLWFVNPVFTGLWLGRRILSSASSDLLAMVVGVLIVLLVIRAVEWLPVAGGVIAWLLLLLSFAYAVGGMLLALRSPQVTEAAPAPPTGPPL